MNTVDGPLTESETITLYLPLIFFHPFSLFRRLVRLCFSYKEKVGKATRARSLRFLYRKSQENHLERFISITMTVKMMSRIRFR